MDRLDAALAMLSRRRLLLGATGAGTLALPGFANGWQREAADLHLPGGGSQRQITSAFPGKRAMSLQRTHPPLLETPLSTFDRDVITPNDQFFVRWHWGVIPDNTEVQTYRIATRGAVEQSLKITLADLLRLPRVELTGVNQCSGNSRGFFQPRVPGAQWGHGAMGNARWLGVSLRHVLDLAGVRRGAVAVRFGAIDRPLIDGAPDFEKTLSIEHARDGEVMLAFGMNGTQLPLLNGFPVRLIVPGWFSTYWIKTVNDIEVLTGADEGYWMSKAYRIPDTPNASVQPGDKGFATVPISRMTPRSWLTSIEDGQKIGYEPTIPVGGIAMEGDTGVARVVVSMDEGASWHSAALGPDLGKYSFRRWDARVPLRLGRNRLMVRCTNLDGITQSMRPIWNSGGYMRANVEMTTFEATA